MTLSYVRPVPVMDAPTKRARTDAGPRSPSGSPPPDSQLSKVAAPQIHYAAPPTLNPTPPRLRFQKTDRVICKVSGRWAAGTVVSLNEDNNPYIVKLDPPIGRLICVPVDDSNVCAVEVCWGQPQTTPAQAARAGALWWTLFSLPTCQPKTRRFAVGDRVACAVEDDTDQLSVWAPGTVLEVYFSLERSRTYVCN